jgi:hypothetical protein
MAVSGAEAASIGPDEDSVRLPSSPPDFPEEDESDADGADESDCVAAEEESSELESSFAKTGDEAKMKARRTAKKRFRIMDNPVVCIVWPRKSPFLPQHRAFVESHFCLMDKQRISKPLFTSRGSTVSL